MLMTQSTPTFTLLRFRQHAPPFYTSTTDPSTPAVDGGVGNGNPPRSNTDNDDNGPPTAAPPLAVGGGGMGNDGDAPLPGKGTYASTYAASFIPFHRHNRT